MNKFHFGAGIFIGVLVTIILEIGVLLALNLEPYQLDPSSPAQDPSPSASAPDASAQMAALNAAADADQSSSSSTNPPSNTDSTE